MGRYLFVYLVFTLRVLNTPIVRRKLHICTALQSYSAYTVSICLSRIYRQAVAMTLCFELQQSHEMDYVLRDVVCTRSLANTYFARKRSDVGCLYQSSFAK